MFKSHPSALALAGACILSQFDPVSLRGGASLVSEDFSGAPAQHGWVLVGDTNLFQWDQSLGALDATWDSSKPNSFFCHPLGTVLTRSNDFTLSFDLVPRDITIGADPAKPYSFELALGLINFPNATSSTFLRGTGFSSPDLVEFDYFPDSGFGATVAATIISDNNEFNSGGFGFPIELTPGDLFHVQMHFDASTQRLMTSMTRNGLPFGSIPDAVLGTNFSDFHVDCLAISSYSDAGQDSSFAGSILAHGTLDNLALERTPPVGMLRGEFSGRDFQLHLQSLDGWNYTLERTLDFTSWEDADPSVDGTGDAIILTDTGTPTGKAFYRVRAQRR